MAVDEYHYGFTAPLISYFMLNIVPAIMLAAILFLQ